MNSREHITFLTQRLLKDHKIISEHFGAKLQTPLIFVNPDFSKTLGEWDSYGRKLSLSQELVTTKPWELVIEVLKHEMAHQMVDEVYKAHGDHHGPWFQKACEVLRVAKWARSPHLELLDCAQIDLLKRSKGEDEDLIAIRRKIEKLMALTNSASTHEAHSASQMVKELQEKYHIKFISQPRTQEFEFNSRRLYSGFRRMPGYMGSLGGLIMRHFHIHVIMSNEFNSSSLQTEGTLELMGMEHNLDISEYVYAYVVGFCKRSWQEFKVTNPSQNKISQRNQYYFGIIHGFDQKLAMKNHISKQEEPSANTNSTKELALVNKLKKIHDDELKDFARYLYPRVQNRSSRVSSSDTYRRGFEEGRNLNLSYGIKGERKGGRVERID